MNALPGFFRKSFSHGVHPPGSKEQTADLPTQRMPFVGRYVMPLNQHIGAPAKEVVEAGQRVDRGQLIAEPGAFVSTSLHSPITGWVRAVANRRFPGGVFARAIEIETDPYATQRLVPQRPADWRELAPEAFVSQVQSAGVVGMGGAAFPSHVKYSIPEGQQIDFQIVRGQILQKVRDLLLTNRKDSDFFFTVFSITTNMAVPNDVFHRQGNILLCFITDQLFEFFTVHGRNSNEARQRRTTRKSDSQWTCQ